MLLELMSEEVWLNFEQSQQHTVLENAGYEIWELQQWK